MDPTAQNETRNLGIAILVPLLALAATSAYVIYVPAPSSADIVVGRLVAGIVLAFFVWNCVLSFQKGRYVSPDGVPGSASDDSRIGPIWAFVSALAVLALIVSLSGPSRLFETAQQAIVGEQDAPTPPSLAPEVVAEQTQDATPEPTTGNTSSRTIVLQLLLTIALGVVLGYFSIHISQLDNKISQRDTALISHSIIYFLITFLNVLVVGSPLVLGFLAEAVPERIFNWAFGLRFLLVGLGAVVLAIDALRVFSGTYSTMRATVERARFRLPQRAHVNGIFLAFYLIIFYIGRVVLIGINFIISVIVWIFVLLYYFVASFLRVVRTTIFSWALLFALIHSIAFVVLAIALLNAPWALTHIRAYFAEANNVAWLAITASISGVLVVSVLLAVIAFVSTYFSWPTAFLTTIPELIAYTLIAVWLNSVGLHLVKGLLGVGPTDFGSFLSLGATFYTGLMFGVVAFAVAIYQSNTRSQTSPIAA